MGMGVWWVDNVSRDTSSLGAEVKGFSEGDCRVSGPVMTAK